MLNTKKDKKMLEEILGTVTAYYITNKEVLDEEQLTAIVLQMCWLNERVNN